jgi:D-ribose pyranose/furanose isomerase RbsD
MFNRYLKHPHSLPNPRLEIGPENLPRRFKEVTHETVAVVRTGEFTPYTNVILVFGVVF